MSARFILAAALAVLLAGASLAAEGEGGRRSCSLRVIEGSVVAVGEQSAEGGISVVTADLVVDGVTHRLLLAPRTTLDEIGVTVEVGDDVRARVFEAGESADYPVRKILNITRGTMIRLRTLRLEPLWDGSGRWQGSLRHGGEGRQYRDGSGEGRQHRGGR